MKYTTQHISGIMEDSIEAFEYAPLSYIFFKLYQEVFENELLYLLPPVNLSEILGRKLESDSSIIVKVMVV
jgi:hypothetical protein